MLKIDKSEFDPTRGGKLHDMCIPESKVECISFIIATMNDLQNIWTQRNDSDYRKDRFGGRKGEEREWLAATARAYDFKERSLEWLQEHLEKKYNIQAPQTLTDAYALMNAEKKLTPPAWLENGTGNHYETEAVKSEKSEVEYSPTIHNTNRYMEVIARLKAARENAGISLADAGAALGRSNSVVNGYERGISHIQLDTFLELCELYGVSPSEILTGKVSKIDRRWMQKRADLREIVDMLSDIIND